MVAAVVMLSMMMTMMNKTRQWSLFVIASTKW
jgi:hypothetical protein